MTITVWSNYFNHHILRVSSGSVEWLEIKKHLNKPSEIPTISSEQADKIIDEDKLRRF